MRLTDVRSKIPTAFPLVFLVALLVGTGRGATRFDVKIFGAKGDAKTDDQAAIMAAAQAVQANGGSLYFPAGTYIHSDVIKLKGKNITVEGASTATAILKSVNPKRATLDLDVCDGCLIQNLTFIGASSPRMPGYTSTDILLDGCQGVAVRNVAIDGSAAAGMVVTDSKDVTIENNDIRNTNADGVNTVGASDRVLIQNNHATNTGDDSFSAVAYGRFTQTANVTIKDNVSKDSRSRGATCIGARGCRIEGNTIINPHGHGIAVAYEGSYATHHPSQATVVGNTIEGVTRQGTNAMLISGASDVNVQHNKISDSLPVFVDSSKQVSIGGSEISKAVQTAIQIHNSQQIKLYDSKITGAGASGISVVGLADSDISNNSISDVRKTLTFDAGDIDIKDSSNVTGTGNTTAKSTAQSKHPVKTSGTQQNVSVDVK